MEEERGVRRERGGAVWWGVSWMVRRGDRVDEGGGRGRMVREKLGSWDCEEGRKAKKGEKSAGEGERDACSRRRPKR